MLGSQTPPRLICRTAAAVVLLALGQVAHAAPKSAATNAALVAALQAVSPDPLGGQLGLVAASTRATEPRSDRVARAEQTAMVEANRKAYAAWKNTRKS